MRSRENRDSYSEQYDRDCDHAKFLVRRITLRQNKYWYNDDYATNDGEHQARQCTTQFRQTFIMNYSVTPLSP